MQVLRRNRNYASFVILLLPLLLCFYDNQAFGSNSASVLVADVEASMSVDVARADELTLALVAALTPSHTVFRIRELLPKYGVSPQNYWTTCPEKLECLDLLADRSGAQLALFGTIYQPTTAGIAGDTVRIVTFMLLDRRQEERDPTEITVEIVGDEIQPAVEAIALAVAALTQPATLETPLQQTLDAASSGRTTPSGHEPLTETARRAKVSEAFKESPRTLYLGVSGSAAIGQLGQQYYAYELYGDEEAVVEEFARLSPSGGVGGGITLSVGVRLRPNIELETQATIFSTRGAAQSYRDHVALYLDDPFSESTCAEAGDAAGECPTRLSVGASLWSVGITSRYRFPSARRFIPFALVGVSWHHHSDIVTELADQSDEITWGYPLELGNGLGFSAGAGCQVPLRPSLLFWIEAPLTVNLYKQQTASYYFQDGNGPFFEELPSETYQLPLIASLQLGVRWSFF